MSRSKVKVTRDKKRTVHSQHPHAMDGMECPLCRQRRACSRCNNLIAAEGYLCQDACAGSGGLPPGSATHFYVAYVMLMFFNDCLEQRGLINYQTDLHQIFRLGRHVAVDVQFGIRYAISQGTLPRQPILGAKSAEIGDTFPSWDSHSRMDGSMAKQMDALTPLMSSTSLKNWVNFGPLTPEFTLIIWQPLRRQMGEIGETCSLGIPQWMAGTHKRICTKFTRKTGLVLRSDKFECQDQKSKVKVNSDKKRAVHSQHPSIDRIQCTRWK